MKDYEFIAFDAQYFLYRNFAALKSRTGQDWLAYLEDGEGDTSEGYVIKQYDFDYQDLVKQFFWTIAKVIREGYSCEKLLLLWDKPPYHRSSIVDNYKGTRVHPCQELLDDWDIKNDPTGYLQMKEDYRIELIKNKAKYWIIDNLNKFGMPSIISNGFEADDLACIFSEIIKESNKDYKSAICSVDSDWMFWTNDKVDFISFNKMEAWTELDVILECENKSTELGLTLFQLKQFIDSTFYSHNDLVPVSTLGWKDVTQLYTEVTHGDFTHITDVDRYEKNMKSFLYQEFPNYNETKNLMRDTINNRDSVPSMEIYDKLKSDGFKVSYNYASNYLTTINLDYYGTTGTE